VGVEPILTLAGSSLTEDSVLDDPTISFERARRSRNILCFACYSIAACAVIAKVALDVGLGALFCAADIPS